MARMWQSLDNETHKRWVDTILNEASDELTDWETTFINNISIRVHNGASLTQAQEETLERIYAEKTS